MRKKKEINFFTSLYVSNKNSVKTFFAMYMFSSRAEGATAIVFDWWFDMLMWVLDCRIGGLIGGFLIYSLVTVFILNFWVCLFSCGFDDFSEFMGLICWRFQWRIGILYVF